MKHPDASTQPGDNDPEEDMRRENEIMKIKLQAEFGAVFGETEKELPPAIEHEFLNNVYEFEKAWEKQELQSVADLLKKPLFIPFEKLAAEEQENTWQSVMDLYEQSNINVDFLHEYPLEVKYRFVTEELPMHRTVFVNMPEMVLGFTFEEFHPNNAADIEELANKFVQAWLEKDIESCMACLSDRVALESGEVMEPNEVRERFRMIFDCFQNFEEGAFNITKTSYDREESADKRIECMLGYTEGDIRWNAILDNFEVFVINGPFKVYVESKFGEWSIMYFAMPGWNWDNEELH